MLRRRSWGMALEVTYPGKGTASWKGALARIALYILVGAVLGEYILIVLAVLGVLG